MVRATKTTRRTWKQRNWLCMKWRAGTGQRDKNGTAGHDDRWAMTTKAGPNYARHVVWALRYVFSHVFSILLMILLQSGSYYVLQTCGGPEWAMTTKAGPNNTRCVVWALGMIFLHFFCILTNDSIIYRFVLCFMDVRRLASVSLDQNLQQQPNTAQQYPEITNGRQLPPTTADYNQQRPKNDDDGGGQG